QAGVPGRGGEGVRQAPWAQPRGPQDRGPLRAVDPSRDRQGADQRKPYSTVLGGSGVASSTRARMAVMLSVPPKKLARPTSDGQASSGDGVEVTISCIIGSLTSPERPSEQRR